MIRVFGARNRHAGNSHLLEAFSAPHHIYTDYDQRFPNYTSDVKLDSITITCVKCFLESSTEFECDTNKVLNINLLNKIEN